ncbi:class I adenylate-forming enzyme family protein [Amycolatopsis suaedae]|uniref:Acyl-CoA synthetase n=1 Tax=Amycolatopsis suaedae TaxID=2510978 RepID=A0A4V2ELT9_9PSEU|nr:AMP-binding protein [Amycolatopsis suaedae]RZQ62725.1 acyl-CoA synthetase [Amycolatopsis suaedae]
MSITPPPGLPRSLQYPDVPVGAILAGAAERYGARSAFQHGRGELSYTQLWRGACRFGNALGAHGIGPGDVVAFHLPNTLSYPVAYFGTMLAGATFSPANPLLPKEALAYQLTDSAATAVVTCGAASGLLTSVLPRTEVEVVVVAAPIGELPPGAVDFDHFHREATDVPPRVEVTGDTLAHLAYTGGTTARSKGVRLTHRNVVAGALQYACWANGAVPALGRRGHLRLDQVGTEDDWPIRLGTGISINLTPWFHAMGTLASLIVPLLTGNTVVLHDRFDAANYLAEAERLRINSIQGSPSMYAALLKCPDLRTRDLSSVRLLNSGAAPIPAETVAALLERFPHAVFAEGYGLTEVTMGAAVGHSFASGTYKPGAIGPPLPDTDIKIVSEEGGDPLPPDTPGEVCIRGPQVMQGYHNRPEETELALRGGWLHTGDIGVLDHDGFLSIVDRKKDLLLYKGYNVYPRELEELLTGQAGVALAAVVGQPDPAVGERPVAFVVPDRRNHQLDADALMRAVNEQVLPYQRLRDLRFVDRIPMSGTGKILKRKLRELL